MTARNCWPRNPIRNGPCNCRPPRTIRNGPRRCRCRRTSSPVSTSCWPVPTPVSASRTTSVVFTDVWVSNLALVMRSRSGRGCPGRLRPGSGNPAIRSPAPRSRPGTASTTNNNFKKLDTTQTDQNGLFRFQSVGQSGCYHPGRFEDQQLATANEYHSYPAIAAGRPTEQTVFFTDRSLYRPGQTIQFKGICIAVDQEQGQLQDHSQPRADGGLFRPQRQGNRPAAAEDQRLRLVQRQLHRAARPAHGPDDHPHRLPATARRKPASAWKSTNGPSSRSRWSPQDGAPAQRQGDHDRQGHGLHRRGDQRGQGPLARGAPGALSDRGGTGASGGGRPTPPARRSLTARPLTEVDGSFTIDFVARPDLSVSEKDEPTFHYSVTADVTDTTGETRSGEQEHQRGLHGLEGYSGRGRLADRPETGRDHHHHANARR